MTRRVTRNQLGPGIPRPTPLALLAKLAVAIALAATLAMSAERTLAMACLLLEAICTVLTALTLVAAHLNGATTRLGAFSYWHEAAVFAVGALASHFALVALR